MQILLSLACFLALAQTAIADHTDQPFFELAEAEVTSVEYRVSQVDPAAKTIVANIAVANACEERVVEYFVYKTPPFNFRVYKFIDPNSRCNPIATIGPIVHKLALGDIKFVNARTQVIVNEQSYPLP